MNVCSLCRQDASANIIIREDLSRTTTIRLSQYNMIFLYNTRSARRRAYIFALTRRENRVYCYGKTRVLPTRFRACSRATFEKPTKRRSLDCYSE